ncbi:MAG: pyridoxal phosphate-dependent aminotransferase [bacterium]
MDKLKVSGRAEKMPPFLVVDVIDRAAELRAQGADVISLAVGEPDFDTPQCVVEASDRALQNCCTHYTHSLGVRELREAICDDYHERYGVKVDPGQVIVTPGTSPAMFLVFSGILEPGEEIILTDPGYPCYPNMIEYVGGRPVPVPVYEEEGFQYRPEMIKERLTDKTRAILINSPSNPTGNLLSAERMEEIAGLGPLVISDEIYHGLVYEGEERSILEFTDQAIVLNGFSKRYAMTGWRVGYCIVPRDMVRPLQKVQQNFFISSGDFVQWAALAALREAGPDVERMREIYNQRRKKMLAGLRELGLGVTVEPTGAFYILANARHLTNDSLQFAMDMLDKAHVGVAPGIDFGENAEGYLRFSYATSEKNIEEGLSRIGRYLEKACNT